MFGLTVLVVGAGLAIGVATYGAFASRGLVGVDLSLFSELGRRFAETGTQYAPFQLTGPYQFDQGTGTLGWDSMPGLYPPLAGPVFAVVRFLPPILWWAIPLGITAYLIASWRPAPWAWPVMALAFVSANTWGSLSAGNTTMWVVALVALGLRNGWPAALIALKPTFLPLALVGVRRRSFWIAVALTGVLTLAMAPELARYLTAMGNVRGSSLLYSIGDLPFALVPVVAWIGKGTDHGQ